VSNTDSNPYRVDEQHRAKWHPDEIRLEEERAASYDELLATVEHIKARFPGKYDEATTEAAVILARVIEDTIGDNIWIEYLADTLRSTEREAEARPDGFVYVLAAGEFYKIGRAKRLDSRIKTLKIQLPFGLALLNAFPCEDYVLTERSLHDHLARYRVNGEWFRLPDESAEWLGRFRYVTTTREDDPWYDANDLHRQINHHERVPAAVMAEEHWAKAFMEVEASRGMFA
jgi:hypothetical protein